MMPGPHSLRALILTPTGRDAAIAAGILVDAGLPVHVCGDAAELFREIAAGAGTAVVAEEELLRVDLRPLFSWVAEQPSWSDFPFIVLTLRSTLAPGAAADMMVEGLGNVTFVERPFHPNSLVSLVRSASRGRRRQYEARARIEDLHASSERLARETHTLERLNRTAMDVAADLDLEVVVQRVVDAGADLTGAAFGAFFRRAREAADEGYAFSAPSGHGFSAPGLRSLGDVFAATLDGDGAVRSADITRDPRYRGGPERTTGRSPADIRSYLAVPVTARSGTVMGGILFGHRDADMFNERSERIASGLAAQAAIAMDNARLFQDVQRANASLEARVEARTRERDRMWRLSNDLMAVSNAEGRLLAANHAWTALLGWSEEALLATSLVSLVHDEDAGPMREQLGRLDRGEPISKVESRFRSREGGHRLISWTASSDQGLFYLVGRDVTAEREIEEQLRQAQKMEAVGQLTGGIAHDFNNLLQGITGSLDLVGRRLAKGRTGDLDRFIAAAMTSANRAAALTHRLLAFSRRQPLNPKPVKANGLVSSMEDLLRRTLGERIELELVLAGGLWPTLCDANQLENAILNLCINARDAMPDGGKLTIQTRNSDPGAPKTGGRRDPAASSFVCISVTDTGTGMAPETISRAFDPFYTTKPLGQGTGLGLSMIYGFMRQSEGHARIESAVGVGTTVTLCLPRYKGGADIEHLAAIDLADHLAPHAEAVLVVEDEPVVRGLIVELLGELGYRVIEARDGPSGLDTLQSDQHVDLLITDIGLPGLNGRQMAEAARRKRPELKVLFMTGYAENATLATGFLGEGMELITKPFPLDALAERLSRMMGP